MKKMEKPKGLVKPCHVLQYCPYGPLVEDMPLKLVRDKQSCKVFGHQCPVFEFAEALDPNDPIESRELK